MPACNGWFHLEKNTNNKCGTLNIDEEMFMNCACVKLLGGGKLVLVVLRKSYTFVVLAILILVFGALAVFKAPTDAFPVIQIPVSSVVWIYDGLMPQNVEGA